MRLVRFIDEQGAVQFGCGYDGRTAERLRDHPLNGVDPTGERVNVRKLLSPVVPPAILCIGLNYRKHAEETGQELPTFPVLFMKNPAAVHHPHVPIMLPACSTGPEVDYECELAVVLARPARNVPHGSALDYVLGYTVGNDVSARRWQKQGGGGQWVRGKSFDTFCPLGPELVTPDEIPDPQTLRLSTRLNGRTMQDSTTADMIFSVADLIAELSKDLTLLPGSVILTGTPSGVGVARDPKVFLKAGDEVVCEIEKIGQLRNPVVDAPGPHPAT